MPFADVTHARKIAAQMGNLTENLPYQGLEDGVVFTRENTMSFGVRLELVSAARATPDVRVEIRDRIMRAVQGALPVGAVVRVYLETRPATRTSLARHAPKEGDGTAVETLLRSNHDLLERLRRSSWVSETGAYLSVTLPIPGRPKAAAFKDGAHRPLIEKATALRSRLTRQLTLGGMRALPMTSTDAWERILDYFNPSMASAEKPPYQDAFSGADLAGVKLLRKLKNKPNATRPNVASMRAQVACSDIDLDHDACFMVGHNRVGIVSFLKPTGDTRYDASDVIISALGGTHSVFVVEYVVVDAPKVRAAINEALDKQETAASDPTMKAGREVMTRIAEGTQLVQQMETGQVLTEMSMHAVIFARSQEELDERRERALAAFSSVGGSMPRIATSANAIVLYLENAPFSGKRSSYLVGAYYRNAVDCVPKVGPWAGTPGGVLPLRGRNGNVFSVTPLGLKNAGIVVAGSAGGGKSVLISMLAAGLVHAHDASLTIIDPKRDYLALFMALDAVDAVVNIAPQAVLPTGERVCINPFDLAPGLTQPDANKEAFLMEFMAALRINNRSGRRVSILSQAIRNFYLRFSAPELRGGEEVAVYTGEGTLTDFADLISRLNTIGDRSVQSDPVLREEVANVANELRAYCGRTPLGSLIDGQTTVDVRSRYLYLDISGMMQHPLLQQVGMLITNELTWGRMMALSGFKVMVQEEAGVAKDLPGLVALTDRAFKTGRSLGVIPILSLQNIGDAQAFRGVINNASTRLLLASGSSERQQVAELFGLNPAMRALHASLGGEAGRFREVLVLQDTGNDILDGDVGQLWLSREAYWISTSVKTEVEARARLAAELYGGDEAQAAFHLARGEINAA